MKKVLGVDIGGVIHDSAKNFRLGHIPPEEDILNTPAIEGSIESLKFLNETTFKDCVYLVSKYGKGGPESIQKWLEKQDFYQKTGIRRDHLYQCAERYEKAPIVRKLEITHFVDDRAEVMSHFAKDVPYLYHFQSLLEDGEEWSTKISNLTFVKSWAELLPILTNDSSNTVL